MKPWITSHDLMRANEEQTVRSRMLGLAGALLLLGLTTLGTATAATAADPVQLATTDLSARVDAAAGEHHLIENRKYHQCLDAPGGALNVRLKLSSCNNSSSSQKWAFVLASATSTYSTFYLVNQRSGYCAEVNNGTTIPGERVDQWFCNGTTAEQWDQLDRNIGGVIYSQFRHTGTGLCLDTVSGAGSQLMQWYCDSDNDAQLWLVR
jgi:hypothetical protein